VVHRFRGHAGAVGRLSFAPNGRTLASAGDDTTILLWDITNRRPAALPGAAKFSCEELDALWIGLRGDAKMAYTAMLRFVAAPAAATAFLDEHLQPVAAVDKEQMATLLAGLGSDKFGDREEAMRQVKQLGDAAEPSLRQALRGNPPLETQRRLQLLLEGLQADRPRNARAVEILERLGDKDARALLQRLAKGAAEARLTDEARGSLQRLEQLDLTNRKATDLRY
jgi:hypothetical protein